MAEQPQLDKVEAFVMHLPYAQALQLQLAEAGSGTAVIVLPFREDLVGDPATGVLHGGAVSALMDTTCGAAVVAHADAGDEVATLDLRIDYMRAATPGQSVRAEAACVHVTRSVAFVRATAWDEDSAQPVATATGVFTVSGATP